MIPECWELLWKEVLKWESGGVSVAEKESLICMLKKERAEVEDLSGVRPISLLNTSYKVYTGIWVAKLAEVVPRLVKNDQRGFIPGRRILDNVMEFQVWQKGMKGEEGLLLLDFAKAYD